MEVAANVRIIPAKQQVADGKQQNRRLNVAAYCRVSTDQEEQQNSYQVQIEYYTNYILQQELVLQIPSMMSFQGYITKKKN